MRIRLRDVQLYDRLTYCIDTELIKPLATTTIVIIFLLFAGALTVSAATLPITSNGSLGVFNPTENAVFNTSAGTFQIGSNVSTGGRTVIVNSNDTPVNVTVFDFTSINIPDGVTVRAVGDIPLILLAQNNATVNGTINISGEQGGDAGLLGGGGGGAGGGAVAIFADSIIVGQTGQILARGGDGGLSVAGGNIIQGGSEGLGEAGGESGGSGGSSIAGGNGGKGGRGNIHSGGGGGGGGGGAYAGPAGVGGLGWQPGNPGDPGVAGKCDEIKNGGGGGDGGNGKIGNGGIGGVGGEPGIGQRKSGRSGTGTSGGGGGGGGSTLGNNGGAGGNGARYGGGGGGGGGADSCKDGSPPGTGGKAGPGGGGGVSSKPGGNGIMINSSNNQTGGAGGGGIINLGAASDSIQNLGLLSVSGGLAPGQQGGSGVVAIFGILNNSGTINGTENGTIYNSSGQTVDQWAIAGGGGGGGGGGNGLIVAARPTEITDNITGILLVNQSTSNILAQDYMNFNASNPYNITITRLEDDQIVYTTNGTLTGDTKQTISINWTPTTMGDYLLRSESNTTAGIGVVTVINQKIIFISGY